ncbi:MAG: amino acid ABC transporter substrate-binding protein [Ruminococcus sp.]|nr:amino acid ABC transporter substrate-binding protein [Ruminococcus sp.]
MRKSILSAIASASLATMLLFAGCGGTEIASNSDVKAESESASKAEESVTSVDESLKKVTDAGKLILGLDATFKPMGYTDENDKIVGFDIDLAEEVCKRLDIKLETYGVNWETKEIDLNAGTIDCIWNGLSVSPSRKEQMLMSDPYMNNAMVFTINSDSEMKTLDDLKGKTIAVQNGSTAQEILADSDIYADITVQELATNVEALNQLELGMCDAVFLDSVVAQYEINSTKKEFKIMDEGLEEEEYAIGFRKGDQALCDKIEETLSAMKADGTVEKISTKWFGSDITTIK